MTDEKEKVKGFLQTKIDLGHIWSGKKITAKYYYRDVSKIIKTEASCDCVHIINEPKYHRMLVEYKPNFPPHLVEKGDTQYETQKSITVTYTVEGSDQRQVIVLLMAAKVMKSK